MEGQVGLQQLLSVYTFSMEMGILRPTVLAVLFFSDGGVFLSSFLLNLHKERWKVKFLWKMKAQEEET